MNSHDPSLASIFTGTAAHWVASEICPNSQGTGEGTVTICHPLEIPSEFQSKS